MSNNKIEEQAELRLFVWSIVATRDGHPSVNCEFTEPCESCGWAMDKLESYFNQLLAEREAKQKEKWEKEARLDGYTKGWREAHKDMHDHIDWQSRSLVDAACTDLAHLSSKEQEAES